MALIHDIRDDDLGEGAAPAAARDRPDSLARADGAIDPSRPSSTSAEGVAVAPVGGAMPSRRTGSPRLSEGDIAVFRQSLAEADRTFGEARAGDTTAVLLAPMLYTVACHNLSTALALIGALDESRAVRLSMLSRLVQCCSCADSPLALRINCVRHMKRAIALLLASSPSGPDGAALSLVAEAQRAASEVIGMADRSLGLIRPSADHGTAVSLH